MLLKNAMTCQAFSELAVNIPICWDTEQLSRKVSTLWANVLPHWHIPTKYMLPHPSRCNFQTNVSFQQLNNYVK